MGADCCACYESSSQNEEVQFQEQQPRQRIVAKQPMQKNYSRETAEKMPTSKSTGIGGSQTHRVLLHERQVVSDMDDHRVENDKLGCVREQALAAAVVRNQSELPSKIGESNLKFKRKSSVLQDELSVQGKQFISSAQFRYAMDEQTNIQKIVVKAVEAHKLNCYHQSTNLYIRALSYLQNSRGQLSGQQINETKAFINSELTLIAISLNKQEEARRHVQSALQNYEKSDEFNTVEERVSLLNNYAIYIWQCGHLNEAKQYCELALQLQKKFFTIADDRLYLTYINLSCLCYQSGQFPEAQSYYGIIVKGCRNPDIVTIAITNREHYFSLSTSK